MKLAFCLYNYFPYGGLEKNFINIAEKCLERGHSLDIFTMSWQGERLRGANVTLVPFHGMSNHRQAASFATNLTSYLDSTAYDLIMGFNKMPNLHLYYAADVCYRARVQRQRSFLARLTPRYRLFSAFERTVFSPESSTKILILSEKEKKIYQSVYNTAEERFCTVPPGVNKKHIRSALDSKAAQDIRKKFRLSKKDNLLLMVGSHFHTKGVDRSIHALASLPLSLQNATHLLIIGKGDKKSYVRLAQKRGVSDRVHFLGTRDDVPLFLAAADFVLQPSRTENTGNAIVEAIVAGTPVVATETCGYAVHIVRSRAGEIITGSPFKQEAMNATLKKMLTSQERKTWKKRAFAYADKTDLYNRFTVIVDVIETFGSRQKSRM